MNSIDCYLTAQIKSKWKDKVWTVLRIYFFLFIVILTKPLLQSHYSHININIYVLVYSKKE